jgi:hypothetical protein
MNPGMALTGAYDGMGDQPFGANFTNKGVFGADLAPAAEIVVPIGRLGYVGSASRISAVAGITAPTAVAMRNALKVEYRLGLFSRSRMGSYDAFVAAGKTDAQIIAGAGRTNRGVNAAATASAGTGASSLAPGGCP